MQRMSAAALCCCRCGAADAPSLPWLCWKALGWLHAGRLPYGVLCCDSVRFRAALRCACRPTTPQATTLKRSTGSAVGCGCSLSRGRSGANESPRDTVPGGISSSRRDGCQGRGRNGYLGNHTPIPADRIVITYNAPSDPYSHRKPTKTCECGLRERVEPCSCAQMCVRMCVYTRVRV